VQPRRVELSAPAKVNFGLRIQGRRPDGYHEIESFFVPVELADDLAIEVRPARAPRLGRVELELTGASAGVPEGDGNLAVRAARGFLEQAGLDLDVALRLHKVIPVGAGLGGGSSDAGAVLRGMADLYPGALARLEVLALSLGADVPFFLDPRPARVSGIGEHIEPLPEIAPLWLLLVNPGVSLATRAVYEAYDSLGPAASPSTGLTGEAPASRLFFPSGLRESRGDVSPGILEELLRNDLQPAALRLCPEVARLTRRVCELGARAVAMSGSGPTVFGIFETEAGARQAQARFRPRDPERVWWTRTSSRRPSSGGGA
jgi:4-diphosphocytidyl-2-C-methyl-D-erythritol kinase